MQIQISWLLQKPSVLDLHCLQGQGISGFRGLGLIKQVVHEDGGGYHVLSASFIDRRVNRFGFVCMEKCSISAESILVSLNMTCGPYLKSSNIFISDAR